MDIIPWIIYVLILTVTTPHHGNLAIGHAWHTSRENYRKICTFLRVILDPVVQKCV